MGKKARVEFCFYRCMMYLLKSQGLNHPFPMSLSHANLYRHFSSMMAVHLSLLLLGLGGVKVSA